MNEADRGHAEPKGDAPLARPWLRAAILIGILVGTTLLAWKFGFFALRDPKRLAEAVRRARDIRLIAPLFVVSYAVIAGLGLPATPLTLAGGAIFGTVLGSVLNWCGAVLGASVSFLLARMLGRDAVRGMLGRWSEKLDALGDRSGFATLFRLRLVPVMPFNVLSFAAGLAGIPFRSYLAATALGIIPGTLVYTYFADSLLAGVEGASRRAFVRVALAAALLLAISFAPTLIQRIRGKPTSADAS